VTEEESTVDAEAASAAGEGITVDVATESTEVVVERAVQPKTSASQGPRVRILASDFCAPWKFRRMGSTRRWHSRVRSNWQGSQFLIATHSPIVLAYPSAIIYRLDDEGLRETSYDALNT
jgi:hypothetical protein